MRTAICSSTAPQGGDGEDRADLPRAVPSVNCAREGTIAITQYLKQAPEIGVTLVRHRADSYRAHGAEARRRPAGALLQCRLHRKYAPPYTRPARHDQCRDAFYFRGVAISRSVYRRRDPHRDQRANDRDGDATRANEQGSWHLDLDVCFGPGPYAESPHSALLARSLGTTRNLFPEQRVAWTRDYSKASKWPNKFPFFPRYRHLPRTP